MSNRWQYQTIEVKPKTWGGYDPRLLQDILNREGSKGWELAHTVAASVLQPMLLILKKEA